MNILRQLEADPLMLVIPKAEIESLNIDPALSTLSNLLSDRATALQYKGKVMVFVDGYNNDSRELYEIPEVRKYLQKLDSRFPYWFFFISTYKDTLRLIAFCLCRTVNVRPGIANPNSMDMADFMMKHFTALNYLCANLSLPEDFVDKLSQEISEYFE